MYQTKLIDVQDILADARDYAECVFMAAAQLEEEQCNPIQTVVSKARRKIDAAIELLDEYRKAVKQEGPAAPDAKPKLPAARTKKKGK
jgi:hypothetical protein